MAGLCGFSRLPAEIRHQIWLLSVPDDEPEICLPWPLNVPSSAHDMQEPLYTLPCQPMTVDTGFPAAMHVCRESRNAAESRVRFRASAAGPTPFRRFRPELDVLYLGHQGIYFLHLYVWPNSSVFDSNPSDERDDQLRRFLRTLLATRRFAVAAAAVPGSAVMMRDFFTQSWDSQWPRPRFSLCYVVPTRNLSDREHAVHAAFVPPGRRCRLASIEKRDWGRVWVPGMRCQPPQTLAALITETLGELRAAEEGVYLGFCKSRPRPEFADMLDDVTAGTFEEYQRDGTWAEVCANRMYPVDTLDLPEIAPDERPDPEVYRVHDADVELRLVRTNVSDDDCEYSDDE